MHPDDFTKMIREDLPFKQHKAWELIHIAERPWIKQYTDKLPVHWTVLGMIAKLEEVEFLEKINDGTINPEMTADDLRKRPAPDYEVADDDDGDSDTDDSDDEPERTGRGKQGKGAASKADPRAPEVSRETELGRRIFEAAIALYECESESVKLNVNGAIDKLLAKVFSGLLKSERGNPFSSGFGMPLSCTMNSLLPDSSEHALRGMSRSARDGAS